MSKFYYQGKIQQENFLTNKDNLLRGIYGNYQLMITEAFLFLFFSVFAIFVSVFKLQNYFSILYIYSKALGVVLLLLALIFEITYRFVLKKRTGSLLRPRIIAYIIFGLILILVPNALNNVVYRLLTFLFITIGGFTLIFKRGKTGLQIVISIGMIAIGLFFIFFPNMITYKNLIFFVLVGVLGIYLLIKGFDFRSRLKPYEDEQKGFTDYKIEN